MLSTANHQGELNAVGIRLPDAPDSFLFPSWRTVAQDWDGWDADASDQWDAEEVDVTMMEEYLPVYDDVLYAVGGSDVSASPRNKGKARTTGRLTQRRMRTRPTTACSRSIRARASCCGAARGSLTWMGTAPH
jgi:hypothetical protein